MKHREPKTVDQLFENYEIGRDEKERRLMCHVFQHNVAASLGDQYDAKEVKKTLDDVAKLARKLEAKIRELPFEVREEFLTVAMGRTVWDQGRGFKVQLHFDLLRQILPEVPKAANAAAKRLSGSDIGGRKIPPARVLAAAVDVWEAAGKKAAPKKELSPGTDLYKFLTELFDLLNVDSGHGGQRASVKLTYRKFRELQG